MFNYHLPHALVGNRLRTAPAIGLKYRGRPGQQCVELILRCGGFEVAAVLAGMKGQRALQVRAHGQAGRGHNAIRPLRKRRDDAKKGCSRRMKQRIVGFSRQLGDRGQNPFALSRQANRYLRR